jgi:uncharacterized membrane protein YoaK (UPF0700 family)
MGSGGTQTMSLAPTRLSDAGRLAVSLALLSFASGCTDVLTFLKLGEVFTSAMTGNAALLGVAIGRGELLAASRSLTALLGFMLGVAVASVIDGFGRAEPRQGRSLRRLLLAEIVLLAGCASLWGASGDPIPRSALYIIILLSAISMGVQGVAARRISSSGVNTIVFTSVLVTLVGSLSGALARGGTAAAVASMRGHLAAFAAYGFGASLVGALASHFPVVLVWLPMAAVLLALGSTYPTRDLERSPS